VTAICLFLATFAYETLSDVLVDLGTRYFNKDMTFTGRTYLWERADDLINERPFLGRGFHAFWIQGNPDAEGMWRYLDIKNEYGFNFHNTFVELLVHLGWLGAIVCGIVFLFGLVLLVLRFVRRPDLAVCFWLSMLAYQCVRMPIETVAPGEFSVSTMLILIPLGLVLGPAPARSLSRAPPT
jgi:exopolysaccharide production protein ExoQ